MDKPCGCCPYCGAAPGHQNPPTGEIWQHKHSPVREPMGEVKNLSVITKPVWWTPEGLSEAPTYYIPPENRK